MSDQPLTAAVLLGGVSLLLFCGVAWVLAIRLLCLARRTRQAPEALLAIAYLLIAGLGYPLSAASMDSSGNLSPGPALALLALGSVLSGLGLAAMFVFTWKAFRPDSRWALGACSVAILAITVNGFLKVQMLYAAPSFKAVAQAVATHPLSVQVILIAVLAFAWPAWESLRYHGLLRRRLSLGLAEPLVANRFLLWGIACSSSVFASVLNAGIAASGQNILEHTPVLVVSSLAGVLNSVLLILAFLPPPSYVRFIERRATAA
jgi:hypothetical protein